MEALTVPGVDDRIIDISIHDTYIDVSFEGHGDFRVPYLLEKKVYSALSNMHSGQRVQIATNGSKIAWIEAKNE